MAKKERPMVLTLALQLLLVASSSLIFTTDTVSCNAIFSLKYRYAGTNRSLNSLKAHDTNRLRMFTTVDIPLGGTGRPDSSGLYFAKIGLGTPSKNYYMQVDTGTDTSWVNCIGCSDCPKRGYHGIDLTLYDPKESRTANFISCDDPFCLEVNDGPLDGCKSYSNSSCLYEQFYGDGSSSVGFFVNDTVQYDQVSGDLQTSTANGTVIFGCSTGESLDHGSTDEALDGILGFGKSNLSIISQLASTGRVKRMFAHCLDGTNGGGIFAIGQVVKPKVNTTPLITNQPHYNINMTAIWVGNSSLTLPPDLFARGKVGTIIDSGTTLAYLPETLYVPLIRKIVLQQPDLKLHIVQDQYTCFRYSDSVDDGFPPVTFYFQNSLALKVYPHEYLFPIDNMWCIGWQNSAMQSRDKMNLTLLGDLVLSNKLVIYDLESRVIGWTEYNCSSSIQVKDERTGTVHLVGPHSVSFARRANAHVLGILILMLIVLVMVIR